MADSKRDQAIIETIDRWERIAAGQWTVLSGCCALCRLMDHNCSACPVVEVFGTRCWSTGACCSDSSDCGWVATSAAMLAAVLGVRVPRARKGR